MVASLSPPLQVQLESGAAAGVAGITVMTVMTRMPGRASLSVIMGRAVTVVVRLGFPGPT